MEILLSIIGLLLLCISSPLFIITIVEIIERKINHQFSNDLYMMIIARLFIVSLIFFVGLGMFAYHNLFAFL